MKNLAKRQKSRGQALSEYLILVGLVAVGSMAIVQLLGSNIQRQLTNISNTLAGGAPEVNGVQAGERHYQVRDFSDFTDEIQDNQQQPRNR